MELNKEVSDPHQLRATWARPQGLVEDSFCRPLNIGKRFHDGYNKTKLYGDCLIIGMNFQPQAIGRS